MHLLNGRFGDAVMRKVKFFFYIVGTTTLGLSLFFSNHCRNLQFNNFSFQPESPGLHEVRKSPDEDMENKVETL